jgi:hypothetical protein
VADHSPGLPRHRGRARRRIDLSGARQTPESWLRHRNLRHRGGPAGVLGPELQGLQMVGLPNTALSKARGIRRWPQPSDGLGRSRGDQPTQSGQRTRPHSGSIRDAGNKGTNAQAIIRTSAIYDHLRVCSSTCNDTPPSSFAGRSYTAGHHPAGTVALRGHIGMV